MLPGQSGVTMADYHQICSPGIGQVERLPTLDRQFCVLLRRYQTCLAKLRELYFGLRLSVFDINPTI